MTQLLVSSFFQMSVEDICPYVEFGGYCYLRRAEPLWVGVFYWLLGWTSHLRISGNAARVAVSPARINSEERSKSSYL